MAIQPKLTGDLGQRFVVRKCVGLHQWVAVGWSQSRSEAEQLERHFATDLDALSMTIVDRGEAGDRPN